MNLELLMLTSKTRCKCFLTSNCPRNANVLRQPGWVVFWLSVAFFAILFTGSFAAAASVPDEPCTGAGLAVGAASTAKNSGLVGEEVYLAASPAAAAGSADDPADEIEAVLAYEEAVKLAIKTSTELKNAKEGVLQAEEMREMLANLRLITGYTPVGPGYDLFDVADRELLLGFTEADTGWRMAAKQVDIIEETIAFLVRSAYDEVLQNTAGLEKTDRALAFAAKKLIQTETKTRLGAESPFNRENARLAYAAEKEQRERLARQLDEAYVSLNKLLGLEPGARPKLKEHDPLALPKEEPGQTSQQKEGLDQPPGQEKGFNQTVPASPSEEGAGEGIIPPLWVDEAGLERHLALILHAHPYIWLQEQKVAQAERELSLYTYNVGMPPYKAVASGVQQEKNNLYALKEEVRKGVRSLYYQLQGLENQYKALEKNLALAKNGLRVLHLRCKLGMAVPLEVEEAGLAMLEIKSGMQDLVRAYGQMKMLYEKPWVIPAAAGSQPTGGAF